MYCMMSGNRTQGMGNKRVAYAPPVKSSLEVVKESELNMNDVLCGRGGWVNSFPGNLQFREILKKNKDAYNEAKKLEKMAIVTNIVRAIRSMVPSGRFLKEDKTKSGWIDIGDAKAVKKCGQAMRQTKLEEKPQQKAAIPIIQQNRESILNNSLVDNSISSHSCPEEKKREEISRSQSPDNASSHGIERRRRFQNLVSEPSELPPPPQKEQGIIQMSYESEDLMKENMLLPAKSNEEGDSLKDL